MGTVQLWLTHLQPQPRSAHVWFEASSIRQRPVLTTRIWFVVHGVHALKAKRAHPRDEPWDKKATPAEPPVDDASRAFAAVRPHEIVVERSSDAGLDVNAAAFAAFERHGNLEIQTCSAMLDQWKAEYLCMSNPFTLAPPVVNATDKWRRGRDDARVTLAELVKGLPRRIEGQFQRH